MRNLMMRILNFNSHRFKSKDSVTTEVFRSIHRIIKVAALIENLCTPVGFKIEVFKLRAKIKGKAFFFGFLKIYLQDIPRISFIRRTIRFIYITEHPCDCLLRWPPGKNCKSGWVWFGYHVALINPCKPLDGCTI